MKQYCVDGFEFHAANHQFVPPPKYEISFLPSLRPGNITQFHFYSDPDSISVCGPKKNESFLTLSVFVDNLSILS